MSSEQTYVHGYGAGEHDRLIHQAVTLEPFLHRNVAFDEGHMVLEVGCGGDPDIGIKLGGLLHRAGFQRIELGDASVILDERTEDPDVRKAIVDNWISVFLSADDRLIERGLVRAEEALVLRREFSRYLHDRRSVFRYAAIQARGRKGGEGNKEDSCCT